MNPAIKKAILTLTGILFAIIGTGSGLITNLAAVPHQLPSSSKRVTSDNKSAAIPSFELDNPLIETDHGIVPARKCAVCIGVSDRSSSLSVVSRLIIYVCTRVVMCVVIDNTVAMMLLLHY
jgi:hypothetical protein